MKCIHCSSFSTKKSYVSFSPKRKSRAQYILYPTAARKTLTVLSLLPHRHTYTFAYAHTTKFYNTFCECMRMVRCFGSWFSPDKSLNLLFSIRSSHPLGLNVILPALFDPSVCLCECICALVTRHQFDYVSCMRTAAHQCRKIQFNLISK